MAYALLTTPTGRKSLKKLPKDIARDFIDALSTLTEHPLQGELLKGRHRFLRSFHWRYQGTDYRAVYQVNDAQHEVVIHYVATRENFYNVLTRLKLKPK